MDKKNLGEKVLAIIKDKKIHQKARWKFLVRDYVVWGLGFLSLLIGAFSLSVMIYMMTHNNWEEYSYFSDSFLQFVVITLPYFWLLFLGVFIFIADFYIKHTKRGYKYRLPLVILGSLVANVFLGVLFYNIGIGEAIDDVLSERAPFYKEFINPNIQLWNQPEEGLLSGRVKSINSDFEFVLRDIDNMDWIVFHDENLVPPIFRIEENAQLNLIGEMISSDSFKAEIVKPMGPGRGFFRRGGDDMMRDFEENPQFFRERMEKMPQMLKTHPEMEDIFREHMRVHKEEVDKFLENESEIMQGLERFNLDQKRVQ